MGSTLYSAIVSCLRNRQTHTTELRVTRVDTNKDVRLLDSKFLLRVLVDEDVSVVRCQVRHLASGREVYLQSSTLLRTFVQNCLIDEGNASPGSP